MPLSEPLAEIGDRVASFYENLATPPFLIYQYDPRDEYTVRNELTELRLWLEAEPRRVRCDVVSLADVFWSALDERGQLAKIADLEKAGHYADAQVAVRQVLGRRPSLADRLVERLASTDDDRSAVLLYRAGALYPSHRTSTILDELKARVDRPVVLLYPGRIIGDFGLSFMGKTEPTYSYRALIVARGVST